MNALIMIAHGSRRVESNEEFVGLVESVRQLLISEYDVVEESFLDCVEPNLEAAIDKVVARGATTVSIFPYFLNSGNHVARDIPEIISRQCERHRSCEIKLLPYLGQFPRMAAIIAGQVKIT